MYSTCSLSPIENEAHWRITGRFTEPVTGNVPVNVSLADLLSTLLAKNITARRGLDVRAYFINKVRTHI